MAGEFAIAASAFLFAVNKMLCLLHLDETSPSEFNLDVASD